MSEAASDVLGRATEWEPFTCDAWRSHLLLEVSGVDGHPYASGTVAPTLLASQRVEPRALGIPDAPVHLNGGTDLRWASADCRDGDELERRTVVEDVAEKFGRSGRLVFYRLGTTYRDARSGALVAESASTTIRRYPAAVRPALGREVGDRQPPAAARELFTVTPSSRDVIRFAVATGDLYEVHHDADFAREHGLPGTITHGLLKFAYLARAALAWAGPRAYVLELQASYLGVDRVGQPFRILGHSTEAYGSQGGNRVDLFGVSADGRVSTIGTALLGRPSP